ncbi:MAG: hypothetical protein AB1648_00230 [Pseudomonadota bacterium]
MPLKVRAKVVDLRTDTPTSDDRFLVDTNAWLWLHYPPASLRTDGSPLPQASDYPEFIKRALNAGAFLHCAALEFAELAHNIEKFERDIYASQASCEIGTKKYRHDYPNQRLKVTRLIQETWADVLSMSTLLDAVLDSAATASAAALFSSIAVDGYDLFMVEAARTSGVIQIVTDDADYVTVPDIVVFTANDKAIRAASGAGKLVTR